MNFAGIDVGNQVLTTVVIRNSKIGRVRTFSSNPEGHMSIAKYLLSLRGTHMRVCLESSNIQFFDLAVTLTQTEGIEVTVLTGKAVKEIAQWLPAPRHKTPSNRARVLAEIASYLHTEKLFTVWQIPGENVLTLHACVQRLAALNKQKSQNKSHLHVLESNTTTPEVVLETVRQSVKHLDLQLKELQQQTVALIQQDKTFKEMFELLISVNGISESNAINLLDESLINPEKTLPRKTTNGVAPELNLNMPLEHLIQPKKKLDNILGSLQSRLTTAAYAVSTIEPGARVFIGTACATPRTLVKTLEEMSKPPADVQLLHFLTNGAVPHENGVPTTKFHHKSFFIGSDIREAIKCGKADYIPISIAQVPQLIDNGRLAIDVALIQVSLPDEHGFVSLGVSVDITHAVVQRAKKVIAELNPNMPRTLGDSFIHLDKIDYLVLVDTPIIEYLHVPVDAIAEQIARYIARIIDDGSTLQVGLGRIPNEMLKYLSNRRDLGIHSDVITDPIVDLIERGVITGNAKTIHKGQIVASFCIGSRRLYDLLDQNPLFSFHPLEYICNPTVLASNKQLVSVTQAFAVDLTGQICADQFQGEFYSGVSTQPDFIRGAANSPSGKPIICLPSTTEDGQSSRIRPLLLAGEGATIPRSDVHYVITEYGIAYLFGKSIRERTLSLIEIAHPNFRPWLLEEAKKLGYLRSDQLLQSRIAYPVEEEREVVLKNGKKLLIRPSKASDIGKLQELFYQLRAEDVYTRFFHRLESLSVSEAEHLCNVDYENEVAFVAITGEREKEDIIGSSCYFVDPTSNLAEVAYMIHSDWQSTGVGSALQQRMAEYAKSRGVRGFTLEILLSNSRMLRLARNVSENISVVNVDGVYEVTILF